MKMRTHLNLRYSFPCPGPAVAHQKAHSPRDSSTLDCRTLEWEAARRRGEVVISATWWWTRRRRRWRRRNKLRRRARRRRHPLPKRGCPQWCLTSWSPPRSRRRRPPRRPSSPKRLATSCRSSLRSRAAPPPRARTSSPRERSSSSRSLAWATETMHITQGAFRPSAPRWVGGLVILPLAPWWVQVTGLTRLIAWLFDCWSAHKDL